jgi:raffinose/stachyose/melibiose transport system substrate-binding protein
LGDELAEVSQAVLLGKMEPKAAADRLEQGLKGWYPPHQGNKVKGADCQCDVPAAVPAVSAAAATTEPPAASAATPAVTEAPATPAPSATPAAAASAAAAPLPAPSAEVEQALSNELETPQQ